MLNQQLLCQMLKKRKEIPEKMKKLKKPPLGEEARKSFLHRCGLFTFHHYFDTEKSPR